MKCTCCRSVVQMNGQGNMDDFHLKDIMCTVGYSHKVERWRSWYRKDDIKCLIVNKEAAPMVWSENLETYTISVTNWEWHQSIKDGTTKTRITLIGETVEHSVQYSYFHLPSHKVINHLYSLDLYFNCTNQLTFISKESFTCNRWMM